MAAQNRIATALLGLLVVGGCARTLTEAEMQVPESVKTIAGAVTESRILTSQRPQRVAIVGMVATYDDDGQDSDSVLGMVNQASGLMSGRTNRALDRALDQGAGILNGLGMTAVPLDATRQALAAIPVTGSTMPLLVRASGLPVQLGLDSYTGSLLSWDNCKPADLAPLFVALQADGLLAAFFQNRERQVQQAGLVLVTKGADGSPQIAWRGRITPGRIAVEAGFWDPLLVNEAGQVESLTRLFAHSFRLLATRMAQDLPAVR